MKLRRANLAKVPPHVESRFEILPRPKNISAVLDEYAKILSPNVVPRRWCEKDKDGQFLINAETVQVEFRPNPHVRLRDLPGLNAPDVHFVLASLP
jgi:hypothetical protein